MENSFWSIALGVWDSAWHSGWRVLIVILLAPLAQIAVQLLAPAFVKIASVFWRRSLPTNTIKRESLEKRNKTLAGVIEATSLVFITTGSLLFIFGELGFNAVPVLASAGIISLAVGFGAQSLVKDVISGIFIVLESQFNEGDWIKVGDFKGRVVGLNLRRTVLRNVSGARHIIPNGEIKIVTNFTSRASVVTLNIPVKVDTNFGKINKIIDKVGKDLKDDPDFSADFLEAAHSLGVEEINETSAVVKVRGKVIFGKKLKVKRELAQRIARAFSDKKIKFPGGFVQSK
jgi:small conductance mechanosensitive channel